MSIPVRPVYESGDPRWQVCITDDGSPTLVRTGTADSMHSGCGAVTETRHVYLQSTGVAQRLCRGEKVRVLEVGFGSGLGWLLTADAALAAGAALEYVAVESQLPPAGVIERLAYERFVEHPELVSDFVAKLAEVAAGEPGRSQTPLCFEFGSVTLNLLRCDAVAWCLGQRETDESSEPALFDAIYFDAYSPASNPRLWQSDIFSALRRMLAEGGRLATYCVSRSVQEAMQSAGWTVKKLPGPPGGKREIAVAS